MRKTKSQAENQWIIICARHTPLVLITGAGFVLHLLALTQTSYANGWDSYFYLLQIQSWFEDGYLISSRISLFYPLLIAAKWMTGDYVIGIKLLTAFFAASIIPLSYWFVTEVTRKKAAGLITAALTLCSPHLFYFSSQYTKNMVGFALLLLMLIALVKRAYVPAIILIVCNMLTHKLTGALSLFALGLFILCQVVSRQKKHTLLWWSIIPIGVILSVPKIFAIHDFQRQIDMFTVDPQCFAGSFFQAFQGLLTPLWKFEIIFTSIIGGSLILVLIIKKEWSFRLWIIPGMFALLHFPFLRWDMNGFSFRFFLLAILFGSILVGILISFIPLRRATPTSILILLCVALSFTTYRTYTPELHDPPYAHYERITANGSKIGVFQDSRLLIAHKGLAEYIKFTTGKDAMSWIPEYEMQPGMLWRITAGIKPYRLRAFFQEDSIYTLGYSYALVPEHTWQLFLEDVRSNHHDFYDDYTTWLNPHRVRPVFLQKFRREDDIP